MFILLCSSSAGNSVNFLWVGIQSEPVFTDGSTYDHAIDGAVFDDVCMRIMSSSEPPNARGCGAEYRYMCMTPVGPSKH